MWIVIGCLVIAVLFVAVIYLGLMLLGAGQELRDADDVIASLRRDLANHDRVDRWCAR